MRFLKLHVNRFNSQGSKLEEIIVINVNQITYCYTDENDLPTHFKLTGDPSVFSLTDMNERYSLKNLMGL